MKRSPEYRSISGGQAVSLTWLKPTRDLVEIRCTCRYQAAKSAAPHVDLFFVASKQRLQALQAAANVDSEQTICCVYLGNGDDASGSSVACCTIFCHDCTEQQLKKIWQFAGRFLNFTVDSPFFQQSCESIAEMRNSLLQKKS